MARYLSAEWFHDVNAAARQIPSAGAATGGALTVQQVVTKGPEGDVRYWVRLDGGALEARLGQAEAPDATVSQSYETAVAVLTGTTEVQAALMAGDIRLSGNMAVLMENQPALERFDAALSDVRRSTRFG